MPETKQAKECNNMYKELSNFFLITSLLQLQKGEKTQQKDTK